VSDQQLGVHVLADRITDIQREGYGFIEAAEILIERIETWGL
jgi:hypothetical protein